MKFLTIVKYLFLLCAYKLTLASDDIETHPNLKLLPKECGLIDEDPILSNTPHLHEFPWMTLLPRKERGGEKRFVCDGTLISSRYVLTVAHCAKFVQISEVRVGDYDITSDTDCIDNTGGLLCESNYQDIAVEEVLLHPEYNAHFDADIALLRLKTPVNFEFSNAGAVCLPTTDNLRSQNLSHATGTIVGWQLLEKNPSTLQKYRAVVYSEEDCKNITSARYSDKADTLPFHKLCAEGAKLFESGGPLMIKGQYQGYEKYIQYGILSTGKKGNLTGIYTDVSKYMKWILDSIKP